MRKHDERGRQNARARGLIQRQYWADTRAVESQEEAISYCFNELPALQSRSPDGAGRPPPLEEGRELLDEVLPHLAARVVQKTLPR